MSTPPVILSIAGSDPSGGAGIQADIKTISALGGYAAAAITAVTVQNTRGVEAVEYLSPDLVFRQAEAAAADLKPAAVKIGMTGTAEIVRAVASVLGRCGCPNVVLDPVMVSTSGASLMRPEAEEALRRDLFPYCRAVTPNLDEASLLAGFPVRTLSAMQEAAASLYERYGCAFLIKGGHLEGDETADVLCDGEMYFFTGKRIESRNLHGTGCTLSSAIAALLGRGCPLPEAVRHAKMYMDRAISAASGMRIGEGNGPLWHFPGRPDADRI